MTAICYKDGILATDSLVCSSDYRHSLENKVNVLKTPRGKVWLLAKSGASGASEVMAEIISSFILEGDSGRSEELTEDEFVRRIPKHFYDTYEKQRINSHVLVVFPDGNYATFSDEAGFEGVFEKEYPEFLGSAHEFLRGAASAGATARDAVALACRHNVTCDFPVSVYIAGSGEVVFEP